MNDLTALAIDFETTGVLPGHRNEPWQIGLASIRNGRLDSAVFDRLIHVGDRPFNKHAPGRHAQLREPLAAAPTFEQIWPDVSRRLAGRVLVAHNAGTERTVLSTAAPLHVFGPWIDTLPLSRLAWPGLPSHALEDLISSLGLSAVVSARCPGRMPHDAGYDAVACAVLLLHLLDQPGWRQMEAGSLIRLSGG